MQLLSAAAEDTTGSTNELAMPGRGELSHFFTLFVWGTFGGTTVKLQISPNGSEWFDVTDADAITVKTVLNVQFRAAYVRAITSGGAAASINAALR